MSLRARTLVARLRSLRNRRNIDGMRRFSIVSRHEQLGIGVTPLRVLARPHRRDHALARELRATGIFEATALATIIEDPRRGTRRQAESWVRDCDNWALTDACAFLIDRTDFAAEKALAWSGRRAEFVKRTGFAIMAGMATHRKELGDEVFRGFLAVIRREAGDARNFVKKPETKRARRRPGRGEQQAIQA